MATEKALPLIEKLAWAKTQPAPGGGESFDSFRNRSFRGLRWAIQVAGSNDLILVAHYRNYNLFKGWVDCGEPADLTVKIADFVKKGEQTGAIWPFEVNLTSLFAAEPAQ